MSIDATSWAWSQTLDPTEKLVLMAICDCHNGTNGRCDPSYEFIAKKACVSTRTAIRVVKRLAEYGLITPVKTKGNDGQQQCNSYTISFEKTECQTVTRKPENRVTNTALPSDTHVTRNEPEEPEVKELAKASSKKATRIADDFEPDAKAWQLSETLGFSNRESQTEFDQFMDHWRTVPGAKGLKLDWQATFRNWLRNARKFSRASQKSNISDKFRDALANQRATIARNAQSP